MASEAVKECIPKYPFTVLTLGILIAVSLTSLHIVFFNMLMVYPDPPFKIEIETNSNSSAERTQNKTALDRPLKKIYTSTTTDGSDDASAPSFKMNVNNWKADKGIVLAVFFLVFVTLFICGLAIYGLSEEVPIFLRPLQIYLWVSLGMSTVMIFAFLRFGSKMEENMNQPPFNSSCIENKCKFLDRLQRSYLCLIVAGTCMLFPGAAFVFKEIRRMEWEKMEITNMRRTQQRPNALYQATSNC